MAVTAIWNVKGWIGSVLNYTVNPEKTENPEWSEKQQQSMLDVMEYAMQSAPKKVLDKIIDYATISKQRSNTTSRESTAILPPRETT